VDVVVISISMLVAVAIYHVPLSVEYLVLTGISVFVFELLAAVKGIYRSWRMETFMAEVISVSGVWLVTVLTLVLIGFATKTSSDFSRVTIIIWSLLVLIGLSGMRTLYRAFLRALRADGRNTRTVAFAGYGKASQKMARHIAAQPWMGLRILGCFDDRSATRLGDADLPLLGDLKELLVQARAGQIDLVYITLPMHAERRIVKLIDQLADTTASVYVVPDIFVFELFHAQWSTVGEMPVVSVFESPFYGVNGGVKRL
jgi:putative colanic acid biosynthesis UDP-glucose lipid carrier transferase